MITGSSKLFVVRPLIPHLRSFRFVELWKYTGNVVGLNMGFIYIWDSTEVFGLFTIASEVRRQGRSKIVTLRAEPVEWNQGPYKTIGGAQAK